MSIEAELQTIEAARAISGHPTARWRLRSSASLDLDGQPG